MTSGPGWIIWMLPNFAPYTLGNSVLSEARANLEGTGNFVSRKKVMMSVGKR